MKQSTINQVGQIYINNLENFNFQKEQPNKEGIGFKTIINRSDTNKVYNNLQNLSALSGGKTTFTERDKKTLS